MIKSKVEEFHIRRNACAIALASKQMLNYVKVYWE